MTVSNPYGSLLATLVSGEGNGHWIVHFPIYAFYQHQTAAMMMVINIVIVYVTITGINVV